MPDWHAVTLTGDGPLSALVCECDVCPGFDPLSGAKHPPWKSGFRAIWDTGATGSVITQRVIDECGLKPTGMTIVHGVHGSDTVETYLVNLRLPNGVVFTNIQVSTGKLGDDIQILIGMDIIRCGDFVITNFQNRTVMSFRVPSQGVVDYVQDYNTVMALEQAAASGALHQPGHINVPFTKKRSIFDR